MTLQDVQDALAAKAAEKIQEANIDTNLDPDDFDLVVDDATAIVRDWMQANNVADDDLVGVHYNNATWQRLSGYASVGVDKLPMIFKLRNADFRLQVTHNETLNTLTIVRYSHDEPMGATHVIVSGNIK